MNANSVTQDQIDALRQRVTIQYINPEGTTSTFAHAFLDGRFYLDTGHSACVDPANFDLEKGKKYALQNLEPKILGRLWNYEGYSLYKLLRDTAELVATTTEAKPSDRSQHIDTSGNDFATYVSHKTVNAMRIEKIVEVPESGGIAMIGADRDDEGAEIHASGEWSKRFNPEEGGYVVIYADGYTSFSPAKAFEDGYTQQADANPAADSNASPAPEPPTAPTAVTDAHVNAFLQYKLPDDVRPDVVPGSPHNSGTNLMTWYQAKALLEHVFSFGHTTTTQIPVDAHGNAVDPNTTTEAHIDPPAPATGEGA